MTSLSFMLATSCTVSTSLLLLLLLPSSNAFQTPQANFHLGLVPRHSFQKYNQPSSSSSLQISSSSSSSNNVIHDAGAEVVTDTNYKIKNVSANLILPNEKQESSSILPPAPPMPIKSIQTMAASTTTAAAALLLASTLFLSAPQSANANMGAAGGVVTSPAIVNSITLEDWLRLPEKKQRQYEGGFLSCKTVIINGYGNVNANGNDNASTSTSTNDPIDTGVMKWFKSQKAQKNTDNNVNNNRMQIRREQKRRVCQPVNLADELLNEIDALAKENPEKAETFKAGAKNILARQRLLDRKVMESKLSLQPNYINYGCAFFASCLSTLVVHPLDTLKVRLMSGKGGLEDNEEEYDDDGNLVNGNSDPNTNTPPGNLELLSSLYDGIGAGIAKEAPASALYLGIYESARAVLTTFPFFQQHILLSYLFAGSIGEFIGSMSRSPAEAIKTRIQTGEYNLKEAIENIFFTPEGRKNTFDAWCAGLFRDIPHGSTQIAVFEFSKILIVNSAADIDVNTLFSEAVLGGLGGGLGAFISTPSDVVVVNVMTSMNEGGGTRSPKDILTKLWDEDGVGGLFSGFKERISYWTIAIGIFLPAYCSLRQYSLTLM
jgi:hypothetical protein